MSMLFVCFASALFAVEISYNYDMSKKYRYELTTNTISRTATSVSEYQTNNVADRLIFEVYPVSSKDNVCVVDIITEGHTLRRYINKDGSIKISLSEPMSELPLFISFPQKNIEVGDSFQLSRSFNIGRAAVPALFNIVFKHRDGNKRAYFLFDAIIELPTDSKAQKSFKYVGNAAFDLELGVIRSAEWYLDYKLAFYNKEVAVQRNMWVIQNRVVNTLKLLEVKDKE